MLPVADERMMAALNPGPSRLIVNFQLVPVKDEEASAEAGRPIFREEEFVEIRVPGDLAEIRCRPVRANDKVEWAQQYAAFRARQEQPTDGTPLAQIPFLTRAQVMEFQAIGIKTAEQVRDMPDVHASKFMGMHGLRRRIGDFLAAAAGAAPAEKLRAELEARDAKIEVLERALKDQGDKIEALSKRK